MNEFFLRGQLIEGYFSTPGGHAGKIIWEERVASDFLEGDHLVFWPDHTFSGPNDPVTSEYELSPLPSPHLLSLFHTVPPPICPEKPQFPS